MIERRIKAAHFPVAKSLDAFDFLAIPSLHKPLVMDLACGGYIDRRENIIAVGNSGTGKSHLALGLGLAACQRGYAVLWTTAAALVNTLVEARDEKRLLRYQKALTKVNLLIVDELGFVPLPNLKQRVRILTRSRGVAEEPALLGYFVDVQRSPVG